jgi:hypothetical protein
MKTKLFSLLFLILSLNLFAQQPTHEVILKNGEKMRIEVVSKNSSKVVYWDENGKRASLSMEEIKSIEPLSGASKILEDKVDDMTGNSVIRTYWDNLAMALDKTYYYQLSKINENHYLGIKVAVGTICSVNKDDKLIIKFEDNELLELFCMEYSMSCRGCAAVGISGTDVLGLELNFMLSNEIVDKLKSKRISKIRLYTSQGYIENLVKEKNADDFIATLKAVDY